MAKLIIGLTGGIGSGKTAVCNNFAKFGIDIIDADIVAREIVEPNTPCYLAMLGYFGTDILKQDKSLDRAKLRQLIFNNDEHRIWLNALLHPKIRQQMLEQCQQAKSPYVILCLPLLFENNLESLVNRILTIDCSEEQQIKRASLRDSNTLESIKKIMASQVSRETRLANSDDIIENNSNIEELAPKVDKLNQFYLNLL